MIEYSNYITWDELQHEEYTEMLKKDGLEPTDIFDVENEAKMMRKFCSS
jgi:hypothetical protein